MRGKSASILLFQDIEVLDFCGPFESHGHPTERGETAWGIVSVQRVPCGVTKEPIVTSGGMRVLPDFDLADCPRLDILVAPGRLGDPN